MKELSIEEKAKAYDETIKRAKLLLSDNQLGNAWIYKLLPELKESENIKIIKAIKYGLDHVFTNNTTVFEVTKEQCLAWLEKQGENKSIDELAQQDAMDIAVAKCFDWDEQKPTDKVEPKFKVGQTIKKEGFNLGFLIVKIEDGFYYNDMGDNFPFTDQDEWELVEQKQYVDIQINPSNYINDIGGNGCYLKNTTQASAWSEEDEKFLDGIIANLEYLMDRANTDTLKQSLQKRIDWLKSLKERYTWKPSDEHYELEEFAKIVRCNLTGISKAVQELFEAKYLQLTGNKMYGGYKD